MYVLFGNTCPMMTEEGGEKQYKAEHIKQSVTRVEFWDGIADPDAVAHTASTDNERLFSLIHKTLPEGQKQYAVAVREMEDIVAAHANGEKPAWVSSDDSVLQAVLAEFYGCAQGEPTALLVNGGRDALHAQNLSTSAQPAAFNYGGLSANTGSGFSATDTVLSGEITTAGGGLIRAQMTYAHTAGTNTSTLTKTYTANGSDSLPVTIASWAAFNASTAGTMCYENALNATATLNVSGDSVTVTFTLTAG